MSCLTEQTWGPKFNVGLLIGGQDLTCFVYLPVSLSVPAVSYDSSLLCLTKVALSSKTVRALYISYPWHATPRLSN